MYIFFKTYQKKKRIFVQKFISMTQFKSIFTLNTKEHSVKTTDLSILGVISKYSDFTFVARINRFTQYEFAKKKDFTIWKKNKQCNDMFTTYFYDYKEKKCKIILINTKNSNNDTFINAWSNFNNIIIIEGRDNKQIAEDLLNALKNNKEITFGKILSLEKETTIEAEEEVQQIAQANIFGEATIITPNKPKKPSEKYLGKETLDNLLFAIAEYITDKENYEN